MKYEVTNEIIESAGRKLHRIRALVDIITLYGRPVKKGERGGWIEEERNLSQDGNAWIYDNARVCGAAQVFDNACVSEYARVCGEAKIYGNAHISRKAKVSGKAQVYNNAYIDDEAKVYGHALIHGSAHVCGEAQVFGNAKVRGGARINDRAKVYGNAEVHGSARVCGESAVCGIADVHGDTNLCGDAWIRDNECYLTIKGLGSRYRDTTIFKTRNGDVVVRCGCFYGTLAEFVDEVEITHGDSKYAKKYLAFVELAKIHFGIDEV